ncbi:MAG: phosphohistidine phosphatase SixA [Gammaproteobacteria bacterium]|nr:phosphohistidine phosphatase SixA [Gammaproteobacteria bacterium]
MKLMLMRHAEAEPGNAYADDALRPLTAEGSQTQKKVAQALKRMGILPERIYTSPRLRARQTAEITAQVLGLGHVLEESAALTGGHPVGDLVALLRASAGSMCVLCVGHEPDMSAWASALLCQSPVLRIKFVKSGVLGLKFAGEVDAGGGVLGYFYRPRDLLALLDGK